MINNRIRVGFHRVGIALALVPAAFAVWAAIWGAYQWGRPLLKPPAWEVKHEWTPPRPPAQKSADPWDQFLVVAPETKTFVFSYADDPQVLKARMQDVFGPGPLPPEVTGLVNENFADVDRQRHEGFKAMMHAGVLSAVAIGLYVASWLLGWIIRGFVGAQ